MKCKQCGKTNDPEAVFCKHCGAPLKTRACPKCGTENKSSSRFCKFCGQALDQSAVQPVLAPTSKPPAATSPATLVPVLSPRGKTPAWAWVLIGMFGLSLIFVLAYFIYPMIGNGVPLSVSGCSKEECPDAVLASGFLPETIEPGVVYPVPIFIHDHVLFSTGWCASDQATLDANLEHLEFVFTIDGVSHIQDLKMVNKTQTDPDSGLIYSCQFRSGVVGSWMAGRSYSVSVGVRANAKINDGWEDYPEDWERLRLYLVTIKAE